MLRIHDLDARAEPAFLEAQPRQLGGTWSYVDSRHTGPRLGQKLRVRTKTTSYLQHSLVYESRERYEFCEGRLSGVKGGGFKEAPIDLLKEGSCSFRALDRPLPVVAHGVLGPPRAVPFLHAVTPHCSARSRVPLRPTCQLLRISPLFSTSVRRAAQKFCERAAPAVMIGGAERGE